ncbi:Hypothetical predicted protein [Pelobates cultripes]|uniref:Uncharacterized protein n=1 Tax=Pelobates cultripes TaxID=61616 RepID=A0AAD1S7L1_PELCU|nr:Hypothetical predicted protein [Pelobates cultripes]
MSTFLSGVINPDPGSTDINNVFSLNPLNLLPSTDISEVFFTIQKLYQQQIKGYWELISLKQYLDHKLVPRGLRPEISLPEKAITDEQIKEWNSILLDCSAKLMQFLVKLETNNLDTVNKNLENELANVKKFKDRSEFSLLENKLQKNLEGFKKHVREKKHKKYLRDHRDFQEGNIFRTKRSRKYYNSRNSSTSGNTDWSDSDSSSSRKDQKKTYSQPSRNRGILKTRNVTFPDTLNLETATASQTQNTEGQLPFLEEDWPLPQRDKLRDRRKWGYKRDKRLNQY